MSWRPQPHPRAATTSNRVRSRRGEGDRLRGEIIDATEQLLIHTGDERAVSIRAIADAVGVSSPAIYLHFPDKATLVYAVCTKQFRIFDGEMEHAAAGARDPIDEIRRRGRAYVHFGLAHPEPYRIMFMAHPMAKRRQPEVVEKAGADAFAHLVDAVQRGISSGAFRPVDPTLAAIGLWTAIHGVTSLLISLDSFTWPSLDTLIDTVYEPHVQSLLRTDT